MNATITNMVLQHLSGSLKTSLSSPINWWTTRSSSNARQRPALLTRNPSLLRNGCPGRSMPVWLNSTVTCRGRFSPTANVCGEVSLPTPDSCSVKNFGHSVFRWIKILFPDDTACLEDVEAARLGASSPDVAGSGRSLDGGGRLHRSSPLGVEYADRGHQQACCCDRCVSSADRTNAPGPT